MLCLDMVHVQKDEAGCLKIQFRSLVCRLILRTRSDPNAFRMLDSVFYLGLQRLFQARIKRFVQLAQRL